MALTKAEYRQLICDTSLAGKFPAVESPDEHGAACRYRNYEGKKCFVGLLIPDDKYLPLMDDGLGNVEELLSEYPDCLEIPTGMNLQQLLDIQKVHDNHVAPGNCVVRSKINRTWDHKNMMSLVDEILNKEYSDV